MIYLSRAVDHEGEFLESLVTSTRDKAAALTFIKKALTGMAALRRLPRDGLRSCRAAMNELGKAQKQELGR